MGLLSSLNAWSTWCPIILKIQKGPKLVAATLSGDVVALGVAARTFVVSVAVSLLLLVLGSVFCLRGLVLYVHSSWWFSGHAVHHCRHLPALLFVVITP
jgi:hypothetical protein